MTCYSLSDYEPYWGDLTVVDKKKGSYYYNYTLTNFKNDYFYIGSRSNSLDVNNSSYHCFYANMNCKLKNIINTKDNIVSEDEEYINLKTKYDKNQKMLEKLIALLGGRAAEKIALDDISTGASNDIEIATQIARDMVIK